MAAQQRYYQCWLKSLKNGDFKCEKMILPIGIKKNAVFFMIDNCVPEIFDNFILKRKVKKNISQLQYLYIEDDNNYS